MRKYPVLLVDDGQHGIRMLFECCQGKWARDTTLLVAYHGVTCNAAPGRPTITTCSPQDTLESFCQVAQKVLEMGALPQAKGLALALKHCMCKRLVGEPHRQRTAVLSNTNPGL